VKKVTVKQALERKMKGDSVKQANIERDVIKMQNEAAMDAYIQYLSRKEMRA
jgi:hypothetical protein